MKSIFPNISTGQYLVLLLIALIIGVWAYWLALNVRVKIEWTTASELDTAGFNVYRRDSPEGPETRINSELIPASTSPLTGSTYQFIDRNVEPGLTYYYELEDVETNGITNRSWNTSVTVARQGAIEAGVAIFLGLLAVLGILFRSKNPQVEHAE